LFQNIHFQRIRQLLFTLRVCFGLTTSNKEKMKKIYVLAIALFILNSATAQEVLFDFDNAPLYTSLPIDQTVGGITAHLSATGQGYSIQNAGVLGFVPAGFAGRILYPNSINLADLLISFDQTLADFSILYCCQELGCDDAATMRVTAFMNGSLIGTNTRTATFPGTWPVDTLSCSFAQGFNSLVVHYDSPPPTCQDYGVIFMADNMRVTALSGVGILNQKMFIERLIIPNPVSKSTTISFVLLQSSNINVALHSLSGKLIKNLFNGDLSTGEYQISCDLNDGIESGIYFLNLTGDRFVISYKLVLLK
jgi:hypothetical protein